MKELKEKAKEFGFTYTTLGMKEKTNTSTVKTSETTMDTSCQSNVINKEEKEEEEEEDPEKANIIFLLSFNEVQRTWLLHHSQCLLYTPTNEHFGIVPIEAMYSGVPVVAVNLGGPLETVLDGKTGFLVPSNAVDFSEATYAILANSFRETNQNSSSTKKFDLNEMQRISRNYIINHFGMEKFGQTLNQIIMNMVTQKTKDHSKEKKEL